MGSPSTIFVANARTALGIALRQMGLRTGEKILLPNFICDVVLHPLLQENLVPVYYPVTQNLTPDWHVLESMASRRVCHALIMVHYFGQPQNIGQFRSFCLRHNLLLLEDNAHGYGGCHAGKLLGTYGDIGISSPKKIAALPSGGALHNGSAESCESAQRLKPFPIYLPVPLLKAILHSMPRMRRIARKWAHRSKDWDDPRLYREPLQPDYGIDWFSRRRIVSTDWQSVASQRRNAWSAWVRFAQQHGLRPVFPEVHPESCPWALPVYANDQAERNRWLEWGARIGISLFPWPALPDDIILSDDDALTRWKTLICFPLDTAPDKLKL